MPLMAPHLGQKVGFEQRLHERPRLFGVLARSRNHVAVGAQDRIPVAVWSEKGLHDIIRYRARFVMLTHGKVPVESHRRFACQDGLAWDAGLRAAKGVVEPGLFLLDQRGPPRRRRDDLGRGHVQNRAVVIDTPVGTQGLQGVSPPYMVQTAVPAPLHDGVGVKGRVGRVAPVRVQGELNGRLTHVLEGPVVRRISEARRVEHCFVVEDQRWCSGIGYPPELGLPAKLLERPGIEVSEFGGAKFIGEV